MNDEFALAIGDVVRLNSAGPDMTVRSVENTYVTCNWFNGHELRIASFHFAQLKHSAKPLTND